MTMELVDGRAGQPHIDSQDMAILHQALFGNNNYVLDCGMQLACTMQDANHALIGTGAAMIQGLAWTVTATETVKIDSGAQGMRRNDIICAHYHRDSSMVESISLDVIKGTPTSDPVALDPEIPYTDILSGDTDAYMPLWRIPIDGISLSTSPVQLFSTLEPVSAVTSDVSSQIGKINDHVNNLAQPWDASSYFTASVDWKIDRLQSNKIGPWVLLTCEMERTKTWTCKAWGKSVMLTIPDWLGAVQDTTTPIASNGSISQGGNLFTVASRTSVSAMPAMDMTLDAGRWVSFSVCWLAAK